MNLRNLALTAIVSVAVATMAIGCKSKTSGTSASNSPARVVLYTSVDDPYVRPLTQRFEQKTGIKVTLVTDAEMSKTAGLAEKIEAEKDSPRADVYWGNEPFHTIALAKKGVFEPYKSPSGSDIADRWRDKDGLYAAIGLRARVIVVSTRPEHADLVKRIKSVHDLADPALKGKVGIGNPAFGTTSGHLASLRVALGEDKFNQLIEGLRANDCKILGGNSAVVAQVASGALLAGLTDNDDVRNAQASGEKVEMVLPDQDGIGTLLMPTTIALVNSGPNSASARKLIDFLLAPEVEKELLEKQFIAYSVRDASPKVTAIIIDDTVVREMRQAVETALSILQGRSEK